MTLGICRTCPRTRCCRMTKLFSGFQFVTPSRNQSDDHAAFISVHCVICFKREVERETYISRNCLNKCILEKERLYCVYRHHVFPCGSPSRHRKMIAKRNVSLHASLHDRSKLKEIIFLKYGIFSNLSWRSF